MAENPHTSGANNTRASLISGASVGLLVGLSWLALSYLGYQIGQFPQAAINLFELLTRILPGRLVTFGLELMIQTLHKLNLGPLSALGKSVEFAMAYILAVILLALLGGLYAVSIHRMSASWYTRGIAAGIILASLASAVSIKGGWGNTGFFMSILWLIGISLLWGLVSAWGVERTLALYEITEDQSRRSFINRFVFASVASSGLAVLLGRWLANRSDQEIVLVGSPTQSGPIPTPTKPLPTSEFVPVDGTRMEITPIKDFYRVDINLLPPGQDEITNESDNLAKRLRAQGGDIEVPEDTYLLIVDGLVEKPLALDIPSLRSFPQVDQYATLTCISNPVGGDLISTTLFQGARLKDVVERAGLKPEAVDIKFTCIDGYTESLPIDSVMDPRTLLCYAMDDQPLTSEHGAPLRLYTPNRFGMKNPKWIVKIEAVNEDYLGYWEVRGWSEQAWVKTTSVIDIARRAASGELEVGGIAFAGSRGIEKVELRVDEGPWESAQLKRPISPLSWVLWRATLKTTPGQHSLYVRATDIGGDLQIEESADTFPDGATGFHSITINL